MEEKEKKFVVRTYTKAELAHLYNPTLCLKGALQVLRRWIIYNAPLHAALLAQGYTNRSRILPPRQVETIAHYLGEP